MSSDGWYLGIEGEYCYFAPPTHWYPLPVLPPTTEGE